jgi:hypothetical protein
MRTFFLTSGAFRNIGKKRQTQINKKYMNSGMPMFFRSVTANFAAEGWWWRTTVGRGDVRP